MLIHFTTPLPVEAQLTFYHPTVITVGASKPSDMTINLGILAAIKALFPKAVFVIKNSVYVAIQTQDVSGKYQTLYLRRIIADLMMRASGINRPKGYVVGTLNDDPFDLRLSNLNILDAARTKSRNSWLTHHLIGLRLEALSKGVSPDEYMETLIAQNDKEGG